MVSRWPTPQPVNGYTAVGGDRRRGAQSPSQLAPYAIAIRSSCAVWWAERLPTFIADSGQLSFVSRILCTKRLSLLYRGTHTASGTHRVGTIPFPRGFHLKSVRQLRTSPPRRALAFPVKSYLLHILGRLGTAPTLHPRCPFSNIGIMNDSTIVVAGATGCLGRRIARALLKRGASV